MLVLVLATRDGADDWETLALVLTLRDAECSGPGTDTSVETPGMVLVWKSAGIGMGIAMARNGASIETAAKRWLEQCWSMALRRRALRAGD